MIKFGELTNAFWRVDQNLASWFFDDLELGELIFLASWFFGELTMTRRITIHSFPTYHSSLNHAYYHEPSF